MSLITEEKKQKILQEFTEYLEEGYDKQILRCEIFWEMDDYYRERSADITFISVSDVAEYLKSKGWTVTFYN